jgi:hypothetical protein
MNVSFNDYIGFETINREYKEFTFNCAGIDIDNKTAEIYCHENIFYFNKDVINNLKKYFKVYLPKYATSFWNSKIKKANFYIGVNDFGMVKGIPYCGNISIDKLKLEIYKTINTYVLCLNDHHFNFNDYINIKIIKINGPDKPKYKINNKFSEYLIKKEKYMEKYNNYINQLNDWRDTLLSISQNKLVNLVNSKNTRNDLIKYIYKCDKNNKFIELLKTNFKLENKTHDEIMEIKDDINNIYYWVTRWKDTTIEKIRCKKPTFNCNFNQHNLPLNLITSISEMTPYWFHNNDNMNLYLIKIKFKIINNDYIFSHYDSNKWQLKKRVLINGYPACISI